MKILHVQKVSGVAGSEHYLLQILPQLAEAGIDVLMGAFVDLGDEEKAEPFVQRMRESGVRCLTFPSHNLPLPNIAWDLAKFCAHNKVNLIHSHLLWADVVAATTAIMNRSVRVVSTKHGFRELHIQEHGLSPEVNRDWYWLLAKATELGIERSFAVSRGLQTLYCEAGICEHNKLDVIHHGIPWKDVPTTNSQRLSPHQILVPGRLVTYKGHQFVLNALSRVLTDVPDAKLVIVGDGPNRGNLEASARDLGIRDAVVFAGWQNNVLEWMSSSDVVVIPSIGEGFGLVFLEAHLASKPIVTFDVPAANEIVLHKKTGILIPPFDSHGLASSIVRLLRSPSLSTQMGINGKLHVKEAFSMDRVVAETVAFYKTIGLRA